jgi:hypothetical protein
VSAVSTGTTATDVGNCTRVRAIVDLDLSPGIDIRRAERLSGTSTDGVALERVTGERLRRRRHP